MQTVHRLVGAEDVSDRLLGRKCLGPLGLEVVKRLVAHHHADMKSAVLSLSKVCLEHSEHALYLLESHEVGDAYVRNAHGLISFSFSL